MAIISHGNTIRLRQRRQNVFHSKSYITPERILKLIMLLFGIIYVQFAFQILQKSVSSDDYTENNDNMNTDNLKDTDKGQVPVPDKRRNKEEIAVEPLNTNTNNINSNKQKTPKLSTYYEWKKLAMDIAGKTPSEIIKTMRNDDPFGVRTFETHLLENESEKGRFLSLNELRALFPCPSELITFPDQRNHDNANAFRNHTIPYFLFFQHLRKAGGTNFCTLAEDNLKRKELPTYYCMPDYHWNMKNRGAGYLTRYTNDEIITNMKQKGHRIAGNEWDPFDGERFFGLPATFATSFRRPLDRALSQFRFECIEDRGCKIKNVTEWWNKRSKGLSNVYTWTFVKEGVRKASIGTTKKDSFKRQELIGKALDNISKFNLVMVMEWLAYAPKHVTDVLGFKNTNILTKRIRPHINQAKREDGQEQNVMGAAGIAKASWTPENYLPNDLYERMSIDLALDEILTDAAKRMFLERIVCDDV